MTRPLRPAIFVLGSLLAATLAVLVLAERLMGAPARELGILALLLAGSGVGSLLLGTLALQVAGARLGSLRLRLALASGVGLLVALVNVLTTSALMFLNTHDLTLLILLLAFAGVVSLAFAYAAAGMLSAKLEALARTAARLAEGDLGARVGDHGSDEVARVAAAFDHMADRLEQAFARQRGLESERRELVTAVSHDLRTPLATTRAMVEALADGVVTDEADVQRYLRLIRRDIQHLSSLIDDLFEMSQIESGALQLRRQPVDVAELIRQVVAAYQAPAAAGGVALTEAVDGQLATARLEADPDRLQRVLRNLLDNAVRHTPPGGAVQVEARLAADGVELAVNDSGPGIAADQRERVFERFFRAEPSRRRVGGMEGPPDAGAGLGLAIARALVEAHQGRIWAEASSLGGASLRLRLPVAYA